MKKPLANEEHLDILRQGVKTWNKWRKSSDQQPDLSGADLQHMELRSINLSQSNLCETILVGADLSKSDLSEAYLGKAHLISARLKKAMLFKNDEWSIDKLRRPFVLWLTSTLLEEKKA